MADRAIDSEAAPQFPTILSQGRRVGNLLFISGQVSMKPGTREPEEFLKFIMKDGKVYKNNL